jgi:hypothetical protein
MQDMRLKILSYSSYNTSPNVLKKYQEWYLPFRPRIGRRDTEGLPSMPREKGYLWRKLQIRGKPAKMNPTMLTIELKILAQILETGHKSQQRRAWQPKQTNLRSQSAVAQAESASPGLAKGTISTRDLTSCRALVRATEETDGADTQPDRHSRSCRPIGTYPLNRSKCDQRKDKHYPNTS